MRSHFSWILPCAASAIAIAGLVSCGSEISTTVETTADTAEADAPLVVDRPLQIVATIRPLELIVRELLDDSAIAERIEISSIVAPEVSPHGFEPTPSHMAVLRRADIVFYNGLGLDTWAARGLAESTRTVRFEDVAELDHDHHHHHDHDHDHDHAHGPDCDHGPVDEHFWFDPELVEQVAIAIALQVGRALAQEGEDPTELMQRPMERFVERVRDTDSEIARALSMYKGRRIVTHHNVFSRLTDRYGLGEPIVLRPLASVEPTPGDLRQAIETIREQSISTIFIEPQFSADAARRVQEATGVRLVEVDPLGGNASSWSELMQGVGDAIVQGFRDSRK